MLGFLTRWLDRDAGLLSPPRQTVGVRLAAEVLESREVPANYHWLPGSGSDLQANTLSNWLVGPGTP